MYVSVDISLKNLRYRKIDKLITRLNKFETACSYRETRRAFRLNASKFEFCELFTILRVLMLISHALFTHFPEYCLNIIDSIIENQLAKMWNLIVVKQSIFRGKKYRLKEEYLKKSRRNIYISSEIKEIEINLKEN